MGAVSVMAASMDATAELIDHRYGNEAGGVAKDASNTAKNALEVTQSIGGLGIKSIAKKLAVDTVLKSVDDEPNEVRAGEPVPQVAGVLDCSGADVQRSLNSSMSIDSNISVDSSSVHRNSLVFEMD